MSERIFDGLKMIDRRRAPLLRSANTARRRCAASAQWAPIQHFIRDYAPYPASQE